jgi:hypothetical protein
VESYSDDVYRPTVTVSKRELNHERPASPRSRLIVGRDGRGSVHGHNEKVQQMSLQYHRNKAELAANIQKSKNSALKNTIYGQAESIAKPLLYPTVSSAD